MVSGFGKELRRVREAAGISAKALAKLSKVGHRTVGALEVQGDPPKLSTIVRLAKALKVAPEGLVDYALEDAIKHERARK